MEGFILKILRLGHAMFLLESNEGIRYLIDPFFDMNPGFPKSLDNDEFYNSIDAVFLTHGHFDHTSGLDKLVAVNSKLLIVAQYELAFILMQKGMENVYPINLGGSITLDNVCATMVPAKHSSSYGETEGPPMYAGEAAGYVFDFQNSLTLYHSGDTAVTSDIKLIQEIYNPTVAILSSSGHFTMGPKEAAYTVKNLLDVKYVIPSHTFPTKENAASKENYDLLLAGFPIVAEMMDRDQELATLLQDYDKTEVIVLGFGEGYEF
jgi:L-ascorbate metabolism protein UlaG (beta-lactamase superfamily)